MNIEIEIYILLQSKQLWHSAFVAYSSGVRPYYFLNVCVLLSSASFAAMLSVVVGACGCLVRPLARGSFTVIQSKSMHLRNMK